MNFTRIAVLLSALYFTVLAVPNAHAALIPSADGQTVYDTILKVNWLANANLAGTAAGRFGVNNISPNGSMSYKTAVQWVAALNGLNGGVGYLGHNNWTLPTTPLLDSTCRATGPQGNFGFDCMNSMMGSLFYLGFGLHYPNTAVPIPHYAIGPFSNFQPYLYWSGTPNADSSKGFNTFSFNTGWEGSNVDNHYMYVLPMIPGKAPGTTYAASGKGTLQVSADGQTVYDPVADLTWLANADLAMTQPFGAQCVKPDGTQCINLDGSMSHTTALNWINGMNTYNGGAGWLGHTNWELPPTNTADPCGLSAFGCTGSPMGELFYNQLGLSQGTPVVATPDVNVGPFNNVQPYLYWSSCEPPEGQSPCQGGSPAPAPGFEYSFSFGNGFEGTDVVGNNLYVMVYYPETPAALPAGTGFTMTSTGAGPLSVSYGQVTATTPTDPVTLAIFALTQNNVLVTEAGIPASGTTTSARIFVDYDQASSRNSGVALVNTGSSPMTVNVTLTSQNGATTTPCANQQITGLGHVALFVNQLGCSALTRPFVGTITFTSTTPFAAVNLRAANNAHGEQIFSALPVADLAVPPPGSGNLVFSQIVDGGGTPTQILLMNTTASAIAGTISFADDSGNPTLLDFGSGLQATLNYSIAGSGMQKFSTSGSGTLKVAYALVSSASGPLPSGAAVFASNNGSGGLASQAGVLNAPRTTAARVYIERASSPLLRDTGVAVVNANGASTPATVTFNLVSFDGSYNQSTTIQMPANGHLAKFIEQIFASASPAVPTNFQGVLNITSNVPISPVTLRLTANQRGDNLFSTLPVADLNNPPNGTLFIPQVVNGGGFTTQIISISTSISPGTEIIPFMNDSGQAVTVPFN